MQGELPLSRNYAGVGRTPVAAGAGQLPRQQPLQRMPFARRSWLGVVLFAMLVAFCLFDMNTVAYNLLGVTQFFSVLKSMRKGPCSAMASARAGSISSGSRTVAAATPRPRAKLAQS